MNRQRYFNFIEEKLNLLAFRIERRGGLNILDLHLHSENFYLHLFNLLFDWDLENLNAEKKNAAGIDLVDATNKIIVQVSATATKQKIESALAKDLSNYKGYAFKFMKNFAWRLFLSHYLCSNGSIISTPSTISWKSLTFLVSKSLFKTFAVASIIASGNLIFFSFLIDMTRSTISAFM